MAKKKAPSLDDLGAQYRDAKAAIADHRRRQAAAEVEHGRLARRLGRDHPDVEDARAAVVQAHSDVRWCLAVTVAAGEAYKGRSLEDVTAMHTTTGADVRSRAMSALAETQES